MAAQQRFRKVKTPLLRTVTMYINHELELLGIDDLPLEGPQLEMSVDPWETAQFEKLHQLGVCWESATQRSEESPEPSPRNLEKTLPALVEMATTMPAPGWNQQKSAQQKLGSREEARSCRQKMFQRVFSEVDQEELLQSRPLVPITFESYAAKSTPRHKKAITHFEYFAKLPPGSSNQVPPRREMMERRLAIARIALQELRQREVSHTKSRFNPHFP